MRFQGWWMAIGVALVCATPARAAAPTYVAECSYGDLLVAPAAWDPGCTGGSPAGTEFTWTGWGGDQAVATGKIRRRYETTGEYDDRIYPLFDGRVTLSAPKTQPCRKGKRQYTHALIEWTVPEGFEYDTPGPQSADFDLGQPCPRYLFGSSVEAGASDNGIGAERPARVWLGGDASTIFFRLKWRRWGYPTATATGRTYLDPPYSKSVRVRVVASRLIKCRFSGNAYSYSRVSFYKQGRKRPFKQRFARKC